MAQEIRRDPDLEWLDHVRPVGLVVAPVLLKELGLPPVRQTQLDSAVVAAHIGDDDGRPALADAWGFVRDVLGWEAAHVAGSPDGPPLPDVQVALPEHTTTLSPTWAVKELGETKQPWQLLVRIEQTGIDPDARATHGGWEATAHQRFERLLRETGVHAGVLISERSEHKDGEDRFRPELRLVYAPKGETSGYLAFPLRDLRTVAGRPMLGGLKLLLDSTRLFADASDRRLPALLEKSREAQAAVSTTLAEQVLGALHELLRGLDAAAPDLVRDLAGERPAHLYEGLLTVMMRLVFILYAEDRDLLPSRTDGRARELYETGYSLRGLYDRLTHDTALNPDTMDERRGAWGQLLALFRLIHEGHSSHFVRARGGKLFDPDQFSFLEGRKVDEDASCVLPVSDGCVLRILEGLMTLAAKGGARERLSYRTLDVEQIGSVYETVMGFRAERTEGPSLAIKAGKNNRTPVFVDLKALLAAKGKNRIKHLKEEADRAQLSAGVTNAVQAAKTAAELAAALDGIVDERGSPRKHPIAAGTPILQPTDERRRTGSHYTPRTLTAPIVEHALAPAFERLGPAATPEQILDLKVCDPAMGSGAFLVEACRALAARLVQAWARHPEQKPKNIPPDEDEELHAKRLVAQRCLYGVDKNPLATDLAKLSLWLATLARDHEFTFIDHALKSGDSLVGLSQAQIAAAHWDTSKPSLPLFRKLVKDRIDEAMKGRAEIQVAPDDTARAIQEARHRSLEGRLKEIRLMGDAVIAAFFSEDKPKAREKKRAEVESWLAGSPVAWNKLTAIAATLKQGEYSLTPFHWGIEFPEIFARIDAGFDAIVGNPPFLGGKSISTNFGNSFGLWLEAQHPQGSRSADIVAHFFRQAFDLVNKNGAFGLIATKTIRQGDTRETGLAAIVAQGGIIRRAVRRLKWPGEASVIVCVVHIAKVGLSRPLLDGRPVRRISAYLVDGDFDLSPQRLASNVRKSFVGSFLLGMGFTFDDAAAKKGVSENLETMRSLIHKDSHNAKLVFPFIGGEEMNSDPRHEHHRYTIDFFDRPLSRDRDLRSWKEMPEGEKAKCLSRGLVPGDYPDEVAEDWPDLLEIIRLRVKPERDGQKRKAVRERWWQYADKRPGLYSSVSNLGHVLACNAGASPHHVVARLPTGSIFAHSLVIFPFHSLSPFCHLQARPHEMWARFFASSMKDDLRYTPSDCFETFPLPTNFESAPNLDAAAQRYLDHRAALMVARNEGMTKAYNRFHNSLETAEDIQCLRELHAAMDRAVFEAYGWHDLAARAEPVFLDETNEGDFTYQGRLFWPSDFRDEVLARLLALNAERHAEEVRRGVAPGMKGEPEDESDEDGDTE
ncbi:N-6 DNA methylase [Bradyrhizobium sp. AUGA SZCCT0158]|nr:N-6 DNA methylase [Bradyrhizobium sp. AUGA SZCCT0158]